MKNGIIMSIFIAGALLIIAGAYLKINAVPIGETLLIIGMLMKFSSIAGLIYFNFSKAKKNIG